MIDRRNGRLGAVARRRMPSGQGPARGAARSAPTAGPRPAAGRGARRTIPGIPRPDAPARAAAPSPVRDEHRVGPRTGVRRAAGPARRTKAPRRPRRVSGRAAALGLLMLGLLLAYAYPLRVYIAQQAQINQLQGSQQEQRQRIKDLADQVARWNDDDYVIAQARARLQLVRAGERVYVVGVEQPTANSADGSAKTPWFRQLWSSVQTADDPPVR